MAFFLFVHGAWHSGWCFAKVADALRREGHHVLAPDLPGIGGEEAELAAVTLEGWGRFVASLVRVQPEPVILCGHSRGGVVISTAAEIAPEAIRALVYIAAFMLPDGDWASSFKARQPVQSPFSRANAISVIGEKAGTRMDPRAARSSSTTAALPRTGFRPPGALWPILFSLPARGFAFPKAGSEPCPDSTWNARRIA